MLIVGGPHCRLSNICPEGKWKKTEVFYVAGERKCHLQGKKVGITMLEWRQLRDNPETAHLFEKLDVMQQPAAVTDSVVLKWNH